MTDLDRMIEEALDREDRSILQQYGEQGMFAQVGGLFQGTRQAGHVAGPFARLRELPVRGDLVGHQLDRALELGGRLARPSEGEQAAAREEP